MLPPGFRSIPPPSLLRQKRAGRSRMSDRSSIEGKQYQGKSQHHTRPQTARLTPRTIHLPNWPGPVAFESVVAGRKRVVFTWPIRNKQTALARDLRSRWEFHYQAQVQQVASLLFQQTIKTWLTTITNEAMPQTNKTCSACPSWVGGGLRSQCEREDAQTGVSPALARRRRRAVHRQGAGTGARVAHRAAPRSGQRRELSVVGVEHGDGQPLLRVPLARRGTGRRQEDREAATIVRSRSLRLSGPRRRRSATIRRSSPSGTARTARPSPCCASGPGGCG